MISLKMIQLKKYFYQTAILLAFCFFSFNSWAQLSAVKASGTTTTNYTTDTSTDVIYVFCADKQNVKQGELTAKTDWEGTVTYLWEEYDKNSLSFQLYMQESNDKQESVVKDLANGLYRVTIQQGDKEKIERAWVINSWIDIPKDSLKVTESTCTYFKITGDFETNDLEYFDPSSGEIIQLNNAVQVEWKDGDNVMVVSLKATIYDLPYQNKIYTLRVFNQLGCEATEGLNYEAVIPKAVFSVSPTNGEAPLTVDFNNQSINSTSGLFEWLLFRNIDDIKRETEGNPNAVIDSFLIQPIINDDFQYTYENTGKYKAKLIARKQTGDLLCVDTTYLEDFIVVDSSFVDAPNFFTPNGDGDNDNFIVYFYSMESVKLSIYNRWGKRLHYWEKSDIQGFENTYPQSVWDGKVNNRYASPGVYYYIVKGMGRDGKRRRAKGFFHLFRDK